MLKARGARVRTTKSVKVGKMLELKAADMVRKFEIMRLCQLLRNTGTA